MNLFGSIQNPKNWRFSSPTVAALDGIDYGPAPKDLSVGATTTFMHNNVCRVEGATALLLCRRWLLGTLDATAILYPCPCLASLGCEELARNTLGQRGCCGSVVICAYTASRSSSGQFSYRGLSAPYTIDSYRRSLFHTKNRTPLGP